MIKDYTEKICPVCGFDNFTAELTLNGVLYNFPHVRISLQKAS